MNTNVSIITPSYNSKSFFKDTFNSVLSQTYTDFEWIIVDDCSTDGTFEYIKELIKNDSRIFLYKTEKNSGTAAARNIGLRKAKGRYITFLDSDDTLDSDYLKFQLLFIKENGPIVSSGYRRKAPKTCTDFFVPDVVDYNIALKGNPLSCLTTMYDKSIIGEVFFREDIDKPEDYVFWLEILKKGFIAKGNHAILATYLIHPGSKSSNKVKLISRMYRVYHNTQGFNPIISMLYVIRWAFYGKKKYKGVR